jgi:antitoxin MazE
MFLHLKEHIMELQIGKWGNSLALRLPAALVKQAGLRDGSRVQAEVTAARELLVVKAGASAQKSSRAQLVEELRVMHQKWPMGRSVVRWMRDQGY